MWIGHPASLRPNFWYEEGKIFRKSFDDPTLKKMIEIARRLDARVIGDDAEEYDEVEGGIQVQEWPPPQRLMGGTTAVIRLLAEE